MALNPWLQKQLEEKGGSTVSVILEVPTSKKGYATNIIKSIGKLSSISDIAGTSFITVNIDSSKISELSKIGTVHYNMPKGVTITTKKNDRLLMIKDKFLGEVYMSKVEMPTTPSRILSDSLKIKSEDITIVPSGDIVKAIKDTPMSKTLTGRNVKLGVIDTGFVPGFSHPMIAFRQPELYTTVPEPPIDGQSHGSWCTFMAGGGEFNHPIYGEMSGVAQNSNLVHVKALTTLGFGSSESVLKAMEIAYNSGCKVVSMSLGGPAQGGVDDDPESKAVELLTKKGMIIVVAAGNDGEDWTIGSPAVSPYAITVGSWGFTGDEISSFSSRGPQSAWYKENPEAFEIDLGKYGENFIKPDVVGYGGQMVPNEEVILTGGVGWFAPYYHRMTDGFAGMHGTSQATPQVAGIAACLVENGTIRSAGDFKSLIEMTSQEPKSTSYGYGIAKFSRFLAT